MRLAHSDVESEALLTSARARTRRGAVGRERLTELTAASAFLIAATTLAVLAPWSVPWSWSSLAIMFVAFTIAYQVLFPVGAVWTLPTQVVFVPMLFVLPTPVVPLCVGLMTVAARVPACLRKVDNPRRIWTGLGDSCYALGPAAVLAFSGHERFAWGLWWLYALAFAVQVLTDVVVTVSRGWFAERAAPKVQLPLIGWVYLVDAGLATLGLLVASACVLRPGLILLVLPLIGILGVFAKERTQRLDQAVHLSSAYRGTAMLLGDVIEADDAYTGSHSRGVLELSLSVADRLRLNAAQRRRVEFGALLHDVGKVRVPKEIINKPGKLTEAEWSVIRRHTIEGEAMLQQVGGVLADVGRVVRSAHEHYNGAGYPDRLAGEDIPIESRIIMACDAYSAMTTDRPYRAARSVTEALAEMRQCAGSQFDPNVVKALCAIIAEATSPTIAAPIATEQNERATVAITLPA